MSSDKDSHKTQITVAVIGVMGVLGAAIIARWGIPVNIGSGGAQQAAPQIETNAALPTTAPSIVGYWRDNWGTQYAITQNGAAFQFTASGTGCQGPFTSQGSGTVSGQQFRSSYRTGYSTGDCTGTITADGSRITSSCNDSFCGPFSAVADRQ